MNLENKTPEEQREVEAAVIKSLQNMNIRIPFSLLVLTKLEELMDRVKKLLSLK